MGISAGKPDKRLCKLHSLEFGTHELAPGGSIRCGRHRDNDIHMPDTMVSRFHSRFTWDKGMERPVVFDNGSQNGTSVDGERVRTAIPLRNDARVTIGPFVLKVELLGTADTPAILKNTGDMVTLFSDDGPDIGGKADSRDSVRELLVRLERERRTGTLAFELSMKGGKAKITYCLGRIMAAESSDGKGLRALEQILRSPGARFGFSRELQPQEEAMNLWISDFLRSRNMDTKSDVTQKFRPTQRLPRPPKGQL